MKKKFAKHTGSRARKPQHADALAEISVLRVSAISEDGELLAEPLEWPARRKPPHIIVKESNKQAAAAVGERILAKLRRIDIHHYQAHLIRVLPKEEARTVLGVFTPTRDGGMIEPVSRKNKESFLVTRENTLDAKPGELVAGVTLPGNKALSMAFAKITERLGSVAAPRAASLIASHMHNLPMVFPTAALAEAEAASEPVLTAGRVDLRAIPLVTIDGEDARDFDDAVFAEPDGSGWHLLVAIADVAYYVSEGSALDAEASLRGNSVYFPDRVIPMLPERLSNGLCSLKPEEDRYCLVVHLWIDGQGALKRYEFQRGLMRSVARLTYEQVEAKHSPVASQDNIITNLFAAYTGLARARDRRGALDLDLPEYKIRFGANGEVESIAPRTRLEAHRLIEAFMIEANVAAADFLLKQHAPGIYRVHEAPSEEKLDDVRQLLKFSGYSLQKGAVRAANFNHILKSSEQEPNKAMIHTAILRAQMQAYYSAENLGHFGLSLQKYCHFTSPIRRYADLVVHRALVGILDKKTTAGKPLTAIALHISETERRAMMAERDASDRYKVSYMARQIGKHFPGVINSLNEYGLFVSLSDIGVTGFVPVRNLSAPGASDFFTYDKAHASFKGQRSKKTYHLGDALSVRVQEANAITGSLIFSVEKADKPLIRSKK